MIITDSIPYSRLHLHNKLVKAYLAGEENLQDFYTCEPSLNGVLKASENRKFSSQNRAVLVKRLTEQYATLEPEGAVITNIEKLKEANTFTVTTGHQLCAYAGPAYFIYKIASVINLTKQLSAQDPTNNFVPVFWMASEDHDFEEISEVNFYGKSWKWEKENEDFSKIPVGLLNPNKISVWAEEMKAYFKNEETISRVISQFEEAYKNNETLSDATRQILNKFFGKFGLVIIEGNDKVFKQLFKEAMKEEINHSPSHEAVLTSTKALEASGYEGQINSREINLFYFTDSHFRQRIEKAGNHFKIRGIEKTFTQDQILNEIDTFPERFSPNVVLRPVYQETILPNIAYIGGPAEVAYWLQLKGVFDNLKIQFPVLLVRNTFLIITNDLDEKISKYGFTWVDLINLKTEDLEKRFIKMNNQSELNFEEEKQIIEQLLTLLRTKAVSIDKQLFTQISIEQKNLDELIGRIQSKFNKALKQKSEVDLRQLSRIKSSIFPNGIFQERFLNTIAAIDFKSDSLEQVVATSDPFKLSLEILKK